MHSLGITPNRDTDPAFLFQWIFPSNPRPFHCVSLRYQDTLSTWDPRPYQAGTKVAIHTIPPVLHYDLSILTCSTPPTSIPFTEGSGYKCWVSNKRLLSSILGARRPRELHLQERPGQMYYELEEIRDAWLDYYIQQNYQSQMMKKEKYYMIKPNLSSIYLKSSSTNGTKRKILV